MEKLTLQKSTIVGNVLGKRILSTVRESSPGLLLPAGQYLLHPPVDNPVYGPVIAIEPWPSSVAPPATIKSITPQSSGRAPSGIKFQPAVTRSDDLISHLKYLPPPPTQVGSPAIKFDSPSIKFDSPSIKFDSGAVGPNQPVVMASRPIAGNALFVTTGLVDLFDAVARAGGVMLVVE